MLQAKLSVCEVEAAKNNVTRGYFIVGCVSTSFWLGDFYNLVEDRLCF